MRKAVLLAFVVATALVSFPASGVKDCSLGTETRGACPIHILRSGSTDVMVDCEGGFAFNAVFTDAPQTLIFLPQMEVGNGPLVDVTYTHQDDADVTVYSFDGLNFPVDPLLCRTDVLRAIAGYVGPHSCLYDSDCPDETRCQRYIGCFYPCSQFDPICPENYVCESLFNRCRLRHYARGTAAVAEHTRAPGPTNLAIKVTANGVVNLLDEFENPTNEEAQLRASARVIWEEYPFPAILLRNDVRITLDPHPAD